MLKDISKCPSKIMRVISYDCCIFLPLWVKEKVKAHVYIYAGILQEVSTLRSTCTIHIHLYVRIYVRIPKVRSLPDTETYFNLFLEQAKSRVHLNDK